MSRPISSAKLKKRLQEIYDKYGKSRGLTMMCGEKLGSGAYRDVYVLKQDPRYVVKVVRDPGDGVFCNVREWIIWNDSYAPLAKWLAPCLMINQTGNVLIQKRVSFKRRKDYPKYIPKPFTDLKLNNFGFIDDQLVACDYASFNVAEKEVSMKYAKWWGSLKNK